MAKIEIEIELLRDLVDASGYVSTFYAMFLSRETPENCGDLNATEYLASEASSIAERGRAVLEAAEQTVRRLVPAKLVGEFAGETEIRNELARLSISAQVIDCVYGVYKTTANFKTSDNREGRIRLHEGKWELFWKDQEPFGP